MADVSLPPVPAPLKMVQPYLRRAMELMAGKLGGSAWPQARLNAMAHLCLSYALQQANVAVQQQGNAAPDTLAFIQRLHFVQQSTASFRHAEDDADLGNPFQSGKFTFAPVEFTLEFVLADCGAN